MEIESQFPGQHPQFDSSECKKVKAHSETTVITERVTSCRPDVRALRPAPREMSPVSHKYFCDSGGCKICTGNQPHAALLDIIYPCVSPTCSMWVEEEVMQM